MSRIDKVIEETKALTDNLHPRNYQKLADDLESYLFGDFDDPTLTIKDHPHFDRLVLSLSDGGRPVGSVEVAINNANRVEYLNPQGVFQNKARQAMKDWDLREWPNWVRNLGGSFEGMGNQELEVMKDLAAKLTKATGQEHEVRMTPQGNWQIRSIPSNRTYNAQQAKQRLGVR